MRKLLTIFTLLVLSLSCTKEVDVSQGEASGEGVEFTASVVNVGETRAELINSWLGDEQVALFASGYDKVYHFAIAADGSMSGDEIIVDRETEMSYTAFYPYDADLSTIEEYEAAYTEGNVDYMKATTKASGKAVNLQFEHQLAALSFTIGVIGEVTDPAISLALDGDLSSVIALEVDAPYSILEANYFVAGGTDLSSALIKVDYSGKATIHSIKREGSNILEVGKQYSFSNFGTTDCPCIIYTAEDMRKVGTGTDGWNKDSYYLLAQDIDLGGIDAEGNGIAENEFKAISGFKGTFDGCGHKISGLYINKPSSDNQGLFGSIDNATIKNLGVSVSVTGDGRVGGIVGHSYNSSVNNCYNEGTVEGSGYSVGGIVGWSYDNSPVSNCYNVGSVKSLGYKVGGIVGESDSPVSNCYNEGSVNGLNYVGGIVGESDDSSVSDCYNKGSVKCSGDRVGGIVGLSGSSMSDCYNVGSVEGSGYFGGVVGCAYNAAIISRCYYDNEVVTGVTAAVENRDDNASHCGLTTAMMKGAVETEGSLLYYFAQGESTAWEADSENINEGYPILRWQIAKK